jgi:hypothetical protein
MGENIELFMGHDFHVFHDFQWLGLAPRRRGPSPNNQSRCGGFLFLSPIDRDILLGKINTKIYQNDNPLIIFFLLGESIGIFYYFFGGFRIRFFEGLSVVSISRLTKQVRENPSQEEDNYHAGSSENRPKMRCLTPNFLFLKGHISPMYMKWLPFSKLR